MMDQRIVQFLEKQTVAGISCLDENGMPYCFSCFYAFDPLEQLLIFKSSGDSKHSSMLEMNPAVAGTINPDQLNRLAIRGIQFQGYLDQDPKVMSKASSIYHQHLPFALAMKGDIWVIRLSVIKMTDQTLGFGKKINWEREEETERETERVGPSENSWN